ncbi:hypothetical protein [Paraburkholderia fungorum]|jgi:hypothetical protein|uniref:Uncharacterized protein n=1 Tax=Paraburkholderia fungorum TaxID=134537 RepID=A0A3R7ETC4_9BURK|nr:hypothetical protein [Paraburkholderia fungorum]RKF46740.1 hypothetical protein BCY88_03865 [Paraburkholderia fungorum]
MYDAEIAATLLNRWATRSSTTDFDTYLELLREGNLSFTYQSGHVREAGVAEGSAFNIESLVFDDGSRTLRVEAPDRTPRWTRWAAVEPLLPASSEA